jgi:RNA polymerase sigma-70 factor (ECF subfamily)
VADEDGDVVQAVVDGDTEAFRTLVEHHKRKLYAVILKLVGDEDLAEELAQETFVKAFRAISDFRRDSSFGTWLVQIGIHTTRDQLRRAKRQRDRGIISIDALRETQRHDLELVDKSPTADPGAEVELREERKLMRRALDELPADYREVLVLKHFEGWSYAQIADVTGDSIGTLKVRAYRARQLLRERLADLGWSPPIGAGIDRSWADIRPGAKS